MKISRDLNLEMSIGDDAGRIHVHAAPISQQVFEENGLLFAKTFSTIYGQSLNWTSGPRFAAGILRQTAIGLGEEAAATRVLAEIHRLTMVFVPTERGWEPMPLDEAIKKDYLDATDVSEVDNAIVFFSLAWRSHPKREREGVMRGATQLWGGSTTSLNSTEYGRSLPTSTPPETSGANLTPASSVPS